MNNQYKVFYLDDEQVNTYFFHKRFCHQFDTHVFQNANDFMLALQSKTPDLIVLDLMMPQISGFDVLRILKSEDRLKFVPVMILTAMDKAQSLVQCFEQGADDFMLKPPDLEELTVRMESLITRFRKSNRHLLDRRIEAVQRMMSGFNHEFNNHLAILQSGVEMLGMAQQDEANQRRVQMMRETIRRSANLLKVLTSLYSPAREEETPSLQDLLQVIESLHTMALVSGGIAIKIESTIAGPDRSVAMGRASFLRVLQAILDNSLEAVRHLPAQEAVIHVYTGCQAEQLLIRISDNGCGIPSHQINRVFDLFYTTKGSLGGEVHQKRSETGLGLSVAEGLVHSCGGRIQIESSEGKGTVVTVFLPLLPARPGADESEDRIRILLLEGTQTANLLLEQYLKLKGFDLLPLKLNSELGSQIQLVLLAGFGKEQLTKDWQDLLTSIPQVPVIVYGDSGDTLPPLATNPLFKVSAQASLTDLERQIRLHCRKEL